MPRSSSSSRSSGPSRSSNTKTMSRGPATTVPPRQTAPPTRQQQAPQTPAPPQQRMGGLGSTLMSGFVGGMAFGAGSQLVRGLFGGHGNNNEGSHNDNQGYGNGNGSHSQGSSLFLIPFVAAGLGGYFFHKLNKGKIASKANKNLFLLKCGGAAFGSYLLTNIFCNSISSNRNDVYNQDMNNYSNANYNQGYTTDYNSNANFAQDRRL
jgi:hypothetical protein